MTAMEVKIEPAHHYWRNTNTFQWTYAGEGKGCVKLFLWSNEAPSMEVWNQIWWINSNSFSLLKYILNGITSYGICICYQISTQLNSWQRSRPPSSGPEMRDELVNCCSSLDSFSFHTEKEFKRTKMQKHFVASPGQTLIHSQTSC